MVWNYEDITVEETPGSVSNTIVMKSNAGFYIGNAYFDEEMVGWFPNARFSGYYRTSEEASIALNSFAYAYH